jgi:hypothetical protein
LARRSTLTAFWPAQYVARVPGEVWFIDVFEPILNLGVGRRLPISTPSERGLRDLGRSHPKVLLDNNTITKKQSDALLK